MPQDADLYDCFVSYARADNAGGWISGFVEALRAEHGKFSGGRALTCFFDKHNIGSLDDWEHRIHEGLSKSRLFLAFLSPAYFASEWCRREWHTWIDLEIAKHILSAGAAPVYIVEVPGLLGKPELAEHEVAQRVAELCRLPPDDSIFMEAVSHLVKQFRRRQFNAVQPYYDGGLDALRRGDLREVLQSLARDLDNRAQEARRGAESQNTVPPYNRRFSGRVDELMELRRQLMDDRAGVISGIHGLGGIGKTELAFTYAHAFASAYPGGRFLVPCERRGSLLQATLHLGDLFRDQISDEERKQPETYFAAIKACLRERLDKVGHILLVLDNVTDAALLRAEQTDLLTSLGPKLHLLATTRLPPAGQGRWLTLGELPPADALQLLENHRPCANEAERVAARSIVHDLGGFAIAVELVAAYIAAHESVTYTGMAGRLGLGDLDVLAEDQDVELRRHNHQRRLRAVLEPTLAALTPAERRALEYSALLQPDYVPLPWLRELVTQDFPELARPKRLGDPWEELWRHLMRLALFSRAEGETTQPHLVRCHRLLQELLRRQTSAKRLALRQKQVNALVGQRDAALQKTTHWQEARWELEPFEALARLWAEAKHPSAAWLLNQAGLRWYDLAEWSRAEPLYLRALTIDEQSYGQEHPVVALRLNNLAQLLQDTNRLAEAEPLMRRALAIVEQSYGPEHPDVATSLNNLASLLLATNRLAEAEPLMARVVMIFEKSLGQNHPNVATALNNLAQLLQAANRLAEAEPLIVRVVTIFEKSLGQNHPNVAIALNNLAQLLQKTNRLAEAEPLMRRALAILEQSIGQNHPDVASALGNLALLLQDTNRLTEAEPLMRRALAIYEQSYGPGHPQAATALNNLAQLLNATNRPAEAEPLARRALAIYEQSYGSEHPNVAICLITLASLLQDTNRLAEAEPLVRRCLSILINFTRATGRPHPHLEIAFENYARLLEDMGLSRKAIAAKLRKLM